MGDWILHPECDAGHFSNQPHSRSKGSIYFSAASVGQKPWVSADWILHPE